MLTNSYDAGHLFISLLIIISYSLVNYRPPIPARPRHQINIGIPMGRHRVTINSSGLITNKAPCTTAQQQTRWRDRRSQLDHRAVSRAIIVHCMQHVCQIVCGYHNVKIVRRGGLSDFQFFYRRIVQPNQCKLNLSWPVKIQSTNQRTIKCYFWTFLSL